MTIFAVLGLVFTSSAFAQNKKLVCDVYYITEDNFGNPFGKSLPDGHAEAEFEDQYHSATIMKRTKNLVDFTAYVDQSVIQMSLAFQTEQTSFDGPAADVSKPFRLGLFYRGKEVILNGDRVNSITSQCVVQ